MMSDQYDPRPGLREADACMHCKHAVRTCQPDLETRCAPPGVAGAWVEGFQVCDLHTPREREEVQREQ